jgi:hypothetical protein
MADEETKEDNLGLEIRLHLERIAGAVSPDELDFDGESQIS